MKYLAENFPIVIGLTSKPRKSKLTEEKEKNFNGLPSSSRQANEFVVKISQKVLKHRFKNFSNLKNLC